MKRYITDTIKRYAKKRASLPEEEFDVSEREYFVSSLCVKALRSLGLDAEIRDDGLVFYRTGDKSKAVLGQYRWLEYQSSVAKIADNSSSDKEFLDAYKDFVDSILNN